MLTSLAFLFILGLLMSKGAQLLHLPGLLGMILTGLILGPYCLNLLSGSLLSISADLRQLALIIILLRAGLALDLQELKKVGRPAILMCFVPACFEIVAFAILGPLFLKLSLLDSLILGSVLAAVSPAVIVPRMLKMIEEKRGTKQGIPQLILAGASVDDVFVIVLFTAFVTLAQGSTIQVSTFIQLPISILLGLLVGWISGWLFCRFFKVVHLQDSVKVLLLLSFSFLFVALENGLKSILGFSGLLAVMSMGIAIFHFYPILAKRLSQKFSRLWVGAELLLFVLVGAIVNPAYLFSKGPIIILVLCLALLIRMIGVGVCLLKTPLSFQQRRFCMIAYCPKATVQAAIGAVPLAMGLACGEIVLAAAVTAILFTAPLGAFAIDLTYKKWC